MIWNMRKPLFGVGIDRAGVCWKSIRRNDLIIKVAQHLREGGRIMNKEKRIIVQCSGWNVSVKIVAWNVVTITV